MSIPYRASLRPTLWSDGLVLRCRNKSSQCSIARVGSCQRSRALKFSKLIWCRRCCGAMPFKHSVNKKPRWSASGPTMGRRARVTVIRGTGGSAVVGILRDRMVPWLLGRDAEMVEEIWKGLFFFTHANSVGATASLALAAVDIALWDLRCTTGVHPGRLKDEANVPQIAVTSQCGAW